MRQRRRLIVALIVVTAAALGFGLYSGLSHAAKPQSLDCPLGSCVLDDAFDAD